MILSSPEHDVKKAIWVDAVELWMGVVNFNMVTVRTDWSLSQGVVKISEGGVGRMERFSWPPSAGFDRCTAVVTIWAGSTSNHCAFVRWGVAGDSQPIMAGNFHRYLRLATILPCKFSSILKVHMIDMIRRNKEWWRIRLRNNNYMARTCVLWRLLSPLSVVMVEPIHTI